MRVFVDTNILLDWLLKDRPCNDLAKVIFSAGKGEDIKLVISTQSILDAHYTSKKEGVSQEQFNEAINCLRSFVKIVGIDEIDLMWAMSYPGKDLEDDAQYASAYNAVCDLFITRDKEIQNRNSDYCPMSVMTPQEFVKALLPDKA